MADDVLRQGVQGITDLITVPGIINLDFADVRTIMRDTGTALMGIGVAAGENRAAEAAEQAISSPLLDEVGRGRDRDPAATSPAARTWACSRSTRPPRWSGRGRQERQHHLRRRSSTRAMGDEVRVTVIATGFDGGGGPRRTTSARPGSRRDAVMDDRSRRELEIGDDDIDIPEFLK